MVTATIKHGDGRIVTDSTPSALTEALRDRDAVFWIDMNSPTEEELALLDDVFGFHPLAIEDTIDHIQRPKIERYEHVGETCTDEYFYIVIHGPDLENQDKRLETREIDMFVSRRFLVTIHDVTHRSINAILARVKSNPDSMMQTGIDRLMYQVIDKLVDNYMPIFERMQEEIEDLEERATSDPRPDVLPKIAATKRNLLLLRRVIGPQRDVLASLARGEVPFVTDTTRVYLRDVQDHLNRAVETIELYRDLILGVRDIYLSSISNNLNRIMKTLTVITVIALPLNLITGFFGMNFDYLPGLHSLRAFWIAIAIMLSAVIGMLLVARKRGWL